MEFHQHGDNQFEISLHGQTILAHSVEYPLFHIGRSQSNYLMHLGHFLISQEIQSKFNLDVQSIEMIESNQQYRVLFADKTNEYNLSITFILKSDALHIEFPESNASKYIRSVIEGEKPSERVEDYVDDGKGGTNLWFSFKALPFDQETIRGSGLQFNQEDLRRTIVPIWVSEWYHNHLHPEADARPRPTANTTYHPQPMFVSSRGYTFYAYGSAYAKFDFSHESSHDLYFVDLPYRIEIKLNNPLLSNTQLIKLPDWVHNGVILSIQGGTDVVERKLTTMHQAGTKIAGIWAQDWCGKRITSFGKRVFWNWQWNPNWYPNLPEKIIEWQKKFDGCRFLVYMNPYIASDGDLFREADEKNFLVKRQDASNDPYLIDFGEFNGGIVDLTNPKAFDWYKQVIRSNILDIGVSGWMADFGEYLPCDVQVYANIPGYLVHNLWPVLWARCNYEAIRDAGKLDEAFFFMRSGYLGVQRYCPQFWAGDQIVNFSPDAGLPSGIRSSLSLSLSNVLSIHTDIGGYFGRGFGRSREVLLRWCEMAAFNIVMRTHEGNRPDSNVQFDSDSTCIEFFTRMSHIRFHLKPYTLHVIDEALEQQRSSIIPSVGSQYFLGRDLLIAPVEQEGVNQRLVSIPDGQWIHIWTHEIYSQNVFQIDAELGKPPVFYRADSRWCSLFEQLQHI